MGRPSDMLKRVDCSRFPIPQAPSSFCSSSQARELSNMHSHIVMYSSGPLYLEVKCNWQLVRLAVLLVASWLCFCMSAATLTMNTTMTA